MSATDRRRLVSRARQNEEPSSAQRHRRQRQNDEASSGPTPLPPYEPPACALSADAQKAIDSLRANYDYSKYRKHLKTAMTTVSGATSDSLERLETSKQMVNRNAIRREKHPDAKKPQSHVDLEVYTDGMEKKVSDLTVKAEQALRQLVDYSNELVIQDAILKGVSENIASVRPARSAPRRRQRSAQADSEGGEDDSEFEHEAPAADENILSAVELLQNAKEEYKTEWATKTMNQRYGEDNDYVNFKRLIHDAQHPEENPPPVPHRSTWFPEDNPGESAGARRRRNNTTDNTNNGSDDEIEMTGVSVSLKCPLSLVTFTEPWSNNKCNHTFEKTAFESFFTTSATVFPPANQRIRPGREPQGPKQVKCPQAGCDKMLQLEDFFIDNLILRKIQRAEKQAARGTIDDDDDDDLEPRGTQPNRPTQIDDDDETVDIEERRRSIKRIKREQRESRGMSTARAASPDRDEY